MGETAVGCWFTGWFCFAVMTMYPTIAIVMPKEIIERPIENVFSHEEFVLSITRILSHFFR